MAKKKAKSKAKKPAKRVAAKKATARRAPKAKAKTPARKTVKPIPDGYHTLTPAIVANDAAEVIDWLGRALGAKTRMRYDGPHGEVFHAELQIGDSVLMVGSNMPGAAPASLRAMVYVKDVDSAFRRALDAGGTETRPLQNQFYGDRSGTLTDPFGNEWTIATHVEDVSEKEMERRMAAMGEGGDEHGGSEEE